MDKINGENLGDKNIQKLKEMFPAAFIEADMIDFDMLKILLGENIDEKQEKYQFTWNGKMNTLKYSQKPSSGTIRPRKRVSKNWDSTQNIYIEGDNLEVLKLLQKTYSGKIKMIYIDPPYNTGGDFVYKDDFKNSIKNYKEQTNQTSCANPETNGRYHTEWLNMIYSRILLSRNLLSEDGVIFVSIDEHEYTNIRKILDEIYGEVNFIATLIWQKRTGGGFSNSILSVNHEYILLYSKSHNVRIIDIVKDNDEIDKIYNCVDEISRYKRRDLRKSGTADRRIDRPTMYYSIETPDKTLLFPKKSNGEEGRWTYSSTKFNEELMCKNIEFVKINDEWFITKNVISTKVEKHKNMKV